jgi:hypothetical protein
VLEWSTSVPALNDASCNGCDDFLGSAPERLSGFVNGQTGVNNPQAQGFQHLAKDGMVGENAVQASTAFINAPADPDALSRAVATAEALTAADSGTS